MRFGGRSASCQSKTWKVILIASDQSKGRVRWVPLLQRRSAGHHGTERGMTAKLG